MHRFLRYCIRVEDMTSCFFFIYRLLYNKIVLPHRYPVPSAVWAGHSAAPSTLRLGTSSQCPYWTCWGCGRLLSLDGLPPATCWYRVRCLLGPVVCVVLFALKPSSRNQYYNKADFRFFVETFLVHSNKTYLEIGERYTIIIH